MSRPADRGDVALIVFCAVGIAFILILVLGLFVIEPPLPPGF